MLALEQPYPQGDPSVADFRTQFQMVHERAPIRAIKLFFYYLSARGVDAVAHEMAFWATSGNMYVGMLLDTDVLDQETIPLSTATQILPLLLLVDAQFLIKLARTIAALKDPAAVLRALRLVPALGDYSILIPWLRSLDSHSDSRIRSLSAKPLCQLRPSSGLIKHHLQSRDARVRASIMEALWNAHVHRSDQQVVRYLRTAVEDENHRVVANALVGLYRLGESQALEKMIALCSTKQQLFRAAMAWAMGVVDDSRAVPSLQRLARDPSFIVRKRAKSSLEALGYSLEEQMASETVIKLAGCQLSG